MSAGAEPGTAAGRLGFVGLGNIGGAMARRMAHCGFAVHGHDVRPGRATELGLPAADSVAAACDADIVFLSLPSSEVVESVVRGEGGVRESARRGTLVVDLSTADPDSTRRLHAELESCGVALVDAGVSGGPWAATKGELTVMAGGAAEALARATPALQAIASRIVHMGPSGAGHAAKAVNNFLNGMNLAATAEAMVVGVKAGLDPVKLLEVVNASSGRNWATEVRFPRIVRGDYLEGGLSNALMAKDLDVYLRLAGACEIDAELGRACRETFQLALDAGLGGRVSNTVVDAIGDRAGGIRLQAPA